MKEQNFYKISFLSGLRGMLEFYDFILYILFSDQIQAVFFSQIQSDLLGKFITLLVFSVSYVIRPLGGFFIGWMGDTIGRKKKLLFHHFVNGYLHIHYGRFTWI